MNLFICLDDKGGMLFNRRRQSRDKAVCNTVSELALGGMLFMSEYSARLFGNNENIIVCESPLTAAKQGDFCFAEEAIHTLEEVEVLYIFRWNRTYPADVRFSLCPEDEGFVKVQTREFRGTSHQITLDIYRRA